MKKNYKWNYTIKKGIKKSWNQYDVSDNFYIKLRLIVYEVAQELQEVWEGAKTAYDVVLLTVPTVREKGQPLLDKQLKNE